MKFRLLVKKFITYLLLVEAKLVLAKYKPKLVVITGSVGKTSAKNAIYTVLRPFVSIRKNEVKGNAYNLALATIGQTKWLPALFFGIFILIFKINYPQWLVFELACRRPGDLKEVNFFLRPDIVVITYFGELPPHIEFFQSRKQLIDEKLSILNKIKKEGLVILNIDDPNFDYVREKIKNQFVTIGFKPKADFSASNDEIVYEAGLPVGLNFRINYEGKSLPISVFGALGRNHIYAFLYAFALAVKNHFNIIEASHEGKKYDAPSGRMKLVPGEKDTLIIDDSYNSSPAAVEEALKTLRELRVKGRKIAVLGDMLELGRDTQEAHKTLGELAGKTVDFLITVGFRAEGFAEGALGILPSKNIRQFEDVHKAGKFLENLILPGDVILIKGSRAMHLEKIVEEIKIPSKAP